MKTVKLNRCTAARSVLAVAILTACSNGLAATFTVTKAADTYDGTCNADCSLREAVRAANTTVGADVITIPAGTYLLTLQGRNDDNTVTGDLDIRENVTINGAGRNATVINGNRIDRVFHVFSGITANINNLKIANGYATSPTVQGAGLLNVGTTNLVNVFFDGNVATGYGGAIESRGLYPTATVPNPPAAVLSVRSSLFTNNCSESGGAMDTVGRLTVVNTVFDGNKPVTINSVYCRNGDGAAIHVQEGTNATIDRSTFVNNVGTAGALTHYWGTTTITNSTFTNNQGIGGNYSPGGPGAIANQGGTTLIVRNSTIANNKAFQYGGGLWGNVTLQNSIVANNTAPLGGPNCSGTPVSWGNNIFGNTTGCSVVLAATDYVGNAGINIPVKDAATGQTYIPLLAGSRAIDRANGAACTTYDQLGKSRPVDGDGNGVATCDIGAIEKR